MSDQPATTQPARRRLSRAQRFSGWMLAVLIISSMTGYWLFNSSAGLQLILSSISRLSSATIQFDGAHGTLHDLTIDNMRIASDEYIFTVHHIRASWHPGELVQQRIHIGHLAAASVHIQLLPSASEPAPATLPESLRFPVSLAFETLKVDAVHFTSVDGERVENVMFALALSLHSDGERHQLTQLHAHTSWGAVQATAQLNGNAPFALSGQIDLSGPAWGDTRVVLSGNLEQTTIRMAGRQPEAETRLDALLRPFSTNPLVQLDVTAEKFNPASVFPEAPSASLAVIVHLASGDGEPLAGHVHIRNSDALPADQGGIPFASINAQATVTPESLQLMNIQAIFAGDEAIRGDLIWHWKDQSGTANLHVRQVNPQRIDSRIHAGRVSGQIAATADAHNQSVRISLQDRSFNLSASVTRIAEMITLEQFVLRRNQSELTGNGKLDSSGNRKFQLTARLRNFNMAEFFQAPVSNLNAAFDASGQLLPELSGKLDYRIQKSRFGKSAVTGSGQLAFNRLAQLTGKAELAVGSNLLLLQGATGKPGEEYQLTVDAPALEHLGFGLDGDLHAHLTWKRHPALHDGVLKLSSRRLSLPGNHQLSGLRADGQIHREALTLNLALDRYTAEGTSRLQDFNFHIEGALADHNVTANGRINDDMPLQLKANGRIATKTAGSSLRWQGQLTELSSAGKMPIRLKAPASLSIGPESVSLGHTLLAVSDGFLSIEHLLWTPKLWKTQGHFSGIAIHPGNEPQFPSLALHMGGDWHFISDHRLTGDLHIHRERGDWQLPGDLPQLAGLQKLQLHVTAQHDRIVSTFELISQQLGSAQARLILPLRHSNQGWSIADTAPLNGEVTAHIHSLKWLDTLIGANLSMNGQLQARAHIAGTFNKPDIQGTVTGQELNILLLEQGIDLQQGSLNATFHHDDLIIDRLHFVTPHPATPPDRLLKNVRLNNSSGSLTVHGNIGLAGNESRLDFKLSELPIAHKTNYWIIASGSGRGRFHANHLSLSGHLMADAGLLLQPPENRPELSEDIVFVNAAPDPSQQKLSLDLNMNLSLGEHFFIRASGLEGRLAGQLQILNDKKNKLKVNGTIAAQDTTFKAYGQDLTVRRGIISFQGPLDDPTLSVLAVREGLQVEAGVEILGSVRHPQVRLVSTPSVSETEKLSWIVLGRKPDPGGLDATTLLSAAGSILGGQSGSGITEQISRAFGLDELTVRQAGIGSSLSGQIGVIGKRLSSRAYLSYERSLATTTMGITKLTYSLTPRITIVTQAGEDNAADLFYTLQFD